MFIELLDFLRCTEDHPPIALVTAITRREGRFVVDAVMGCPSCRREYAIVDGVASFVGAAVSKPVDAAFQREPEGAVRVAAFLAVSDGSTIALADDWAPYAAEVAEMVGARVFAINSPVSLDESERLGVLHTGHRLPFADAALGGVAIGSEGWTGGDLVRIVSRLASGGRLVAPAATALPPGMDEIARDDAVWIAEKRGPLVALYRR